MKIKYIIIAAIFLSFILLLSNFNQANQSEGNNPERQQQQAISDARNADRDVHLAYLQCYALGNDKRRCLSQLIANYIDQELRDKIHYTMNYQYEAERLGFVHFLQEQGADCDELRTGPKFFQDTESYVAKCTNGKIYLLKFDDTSKEWKFVK